MFVHIETGEYPVYEGDIRLRFADRISFAAVGTFEPPEGYAQVQATEPPAHDRLTQRVVEGPPSKALGVWLQTWTVVAIPAEEQAARAAAADAQRVAALWQAAHDYESSQISGSAIGLLTLCVLQAKPKCLTVQGWIKSIWTTYYSRKASGSADTDFAGAGDIPHSVPELMAELGL